MLLQGLGVTRRLLVLLRPARVRAKVAVKEPVKVVVKVAARVLVKVVVKVAVKVAVKVVVKVLAKVPAKVQVKALVRARPNPVLNRLEAVALALEAALTPEIPPQAAQMMLVSCQGPSPFLPSASKSFAPFQNSVHTTLFQNSTYTDPCGVGKKRKSKKNRKAKRSSRASKRGEKRRSKS